MTYNGRAGEVSRIDALLLIRKHGDLVTDRSFASVASLPLDRARRVLNKCYNSGLVTRSYYGESDHYLYRRVL